MSAISSWRSRAISLCVALAAPLGVGFLAGCGDSDPSAQATSSPPAETATATATAPAEMPTVAEAIAEVKRQMPDSPIYREAKYSGVVWSDTEVCVTQVLALSPPNSHFIVYWPDRVFQRQALDGKCPKSSRAEAAGAAAKDERLTEITRTFYLAMDDLAIQLNEAIRRAQDGNPVGLEKISTLRTKIKATNSKYLQDTAEMSVGGNQLESAATTARDAAEYGDIAVMARARADITEARATLADEGVGG
jgi:hypothetical protein